MSVSRQPVHSTRTALSSLVDYAGLFPPAALDMAAALRDYARARASSHAWMLGRFIVAASRLDELAATRSEAPVPCAVILDGERDARGWFGSIAALLEALARRGADLPMEVVEVALPSLASRRESHEAAIGQLRGLLERAGFAGLPAFVEWPRDERWLSDLPATMVALRRYRLGAKVRCGGTSAAAFPSVDELAAFVRAATVAGVPFKATAGLHHPIRRRDAQLDVTMHGFLNLLAAATFASQVDEETLRAILAEEDVAHLVLGEDALRWRHVHASSELLARVRASGFVSYGSCSFSEPVEDLIALQAIPA